jgi:hypothetical protein
MGRTIGFSLVCLSLAAAFFISLSSAEEDQRKPADNPFAGKIVTVYLNGAASESGQVLENAEIKEVGGRTMLVGIIGCGYGTERELDGRPYCWSRVGFGCDVLHNDKRTVQKNVARTRNLDATVRRGDSTAML